MKNQIIFRPIIKKDYLAIEKIIREAWHYDIGLNKDSIFLIS